MADSEEPTHTKTSTKKTKKTPEVSSKKTTSPKAKVAEQTKKRNNDKAVEENKPQPAEVPAPNRLNAALENMRKKARRAEPYIPKDRTEDHASVKDSGGWAEDVFSEEAVSEWKMESGPPTSKYRSHKMTVTSKLNRSPLRAKLRNMHVDFAACHGLGQLGGMNEGLSGARFSLTLSSGAPPSVLEKDPDIIAKQEATVEAVKRGAARLIRLMWEDPTIQPALKTELKKEAMTNIKNRNQTKKVTVKDFDKDGPLYGEMMNMAYEKWCKKASVFYNYKKKSKTGADGEEQLEFQDEEEEEESNEEDKANKKTRIFTNCYVFRDPTKFSTSTKNAQSDATHAEEKADYGMDKETLSKATMEGTPLKKLRSIMEKLGYIYQPVSYYDSRGRPIAVKDWTKPVVWTGAIVNCEITLSPKSHKTQQTFGVDIMFNQSMTIKVNGTPYTRTKAVVDGDEDLFGEDIVQYVDDELPVSEDLDNNSNADTSAMLRDYLGPYPTSEDDYPPKANLSRANTNAKLDTHKDALSASAQKRDTNYDDHYIPEDEDTQHGMDDQ
jgi:hypothetical protein